MLVSTHLFPQEVRNMYPKPKGSGARGDSKSNSPKKTDDVDVYWSYENETQLDWNDYQLELSPSHENLISVLPKEFGLYDYIPMVGDQGEDRKCAAFASAFYMKTIANNFLNKISARTSDFYKNADNYVFNPEYTFTLCKKGELPCENGIELEEALSVIKFLGAVTYSETVALLKTKEVNCHESFYKDLSETSTKHQSSDMVSIPYSEIEIKSLIYTGKPVGIVGWVDNTFKDIGKDTKYTSGKVPFFWNSYSLTAPFNKRALGKHSMVLIGWSDPLKSFIAINSFGLDWGNRGYVFIPYSFIDTRIKVINEGRYEYITPVFKYSYLIEKEPDLQYAEIRDFRFEPGNVNYLYKPIPLPFNEVFSLRPLQYNQFYQFKIGCQHIDYKKGTFGLALYDTYYDTLIYRSLPLRPGQSVVVRPRNQSVDLKITVEKIYPQALFLAGGNSADIRIQIVKRKLF